MKSKNSTILILYSEYMNYTDSVVRNLTQLGHIVHVVHRDFRKNSRYEPKNYNNVCFYKRSELNFLKLYKLVSNISPNAVIVSGWQDKTYLFLCLFLKHLLGISRIFMASDNQIKKTMKQRFISSFGFYKLIKFLFFTHAWVSGYRQYAFASRMGFDKEQIVTGLYSCDAQLFQNKKINTNSAKKFYFVGRLEKVKSFDLLMKAWSRLVKTENIFEWELNIIGNGALRDLLNVENIPEQTVFHGELPQTELASLLDSGGIFILPSRHEPWGVVLHEAASMGMPLISSSNVGSSDHFLIHGYNGYELKKVTVEDILNSLLFFIQSPELELIKMGDRSIKLSLQITSNLSAVKLHNAIIL